MNCQLPTLELKRSPPVIDIHILPPSGVLNPDGLNMTISELYTYLNSNLPNYLECNINEIINTLKNNYTISTGLKIIIAFLIIIPIINILILLIKA